MTNEAVRVSQQPGFDDLLLLHFMTIFATRILVLLVRENHLEIGTEVPAFWCRQERFTKTREWIPRRIVWRGFDMTVRTDPWRRPLTREELLPVTVEARLMLRKLSHVRKSVVTLARLFPILRRKLMA